eukprot:188793_1
MGYTSCMWAICATAAVLCICFGSFAIKDASEFEKSFEDTCVHYRSGDYEGCYCEGGGCQFREYYYKSIQCNDTVLVYKTECQHEVPEVHSDGTCYISSCKEATISWSKHDDLKVVMILWWVGAGISFICCVGIGFYGFCKDGF